MLIVALHDGHLTFAESGSMVGLYVVYVGVVVSESWWMRRIRRRQGLKHKLSSNSISQLVKPMVVNGRLSPLPPSSMEPPSPVPIQAADREQAIFLTPGSETPTRRRTSRSHPNLIPHHYHSEPLDLPTPRANMSLLGAVEFRDVVNSLRREGSTQPSTRSNSPGGTPTPGGGRERSDYFGPAGHSHRRSISQGYAFQPQAIGMDRRTSSIRGRRRSSIHSVDIMDRDRRRTISAPSPIPASPRSSEGGDQTKAPTPVGLGISSSELNPWSDQTGHPPTPLPGFTTPSEQTSPTRSKPSLAKLVIPDNSFSQTRSSHKPPVPSISIVDPSGHTSSSPLLLTPPSRSTTSKRQKIHKNIKIALRVLFPSLQSFRHKSVLGMILAIMSVPAILALTLTLPVVDDGNEMEQGKVRLEGGDEYEGGGDGDLDGDYLSDGYDRDGNIDGDDETYGDGEGEEYDYDQGEEEADRLLNPQIGEELHHLVDHGFSPLHSPLGRIYHAAKSRMNQHVEFGHGDEGDLGSGDLSPARNEEEDGYGNEYGEEDDFFAREEGKEIDEECEEECEQAMEFNKYLVATQCVLGPAFCCFIMFNNQTYFKWVMLGSSVAGLIIAIPVLLFGKDGTAQPWRLVRCFAGFICSMMWIAAIADEVVDVLSTLGEILGLSDAIIGLTIFAVGNSLADLVANVTVAQFAPAMAYAACFGGPMLNLLLGVGGSGTYHVLFSSPHSPIIVDFSPTLWVSATGLVLMLVATAIFVPLNGYLIDRHWAACLIAGYIILMTVNVGVELKTGRD